MNREPEKDNGVHHSRLPVFDWLFAEEVPVEPGAIRRLAAAIGRPTQCQAASHRIRYRVRMARPASPLGLAGSGTIAAAGVSHPHGNVDLGCRRNHRDADHLWQLPRYLLRSRAGALGFEDRISGGLHGSARALAFGLASERVKDTQSFPPGPGGGGLACNSPAAPVCMWVDQKTFGEVDFYNGAASSLSDAAAKTSQVRAAVER